MPKLILLLGLAGCALVISWLATPLVIRTCRHHHVLDKPNRRKVHTNGVPRLGGVALFLAMSVGMVVVLALDMTGLIDLSLTLGHLLPVVYLGLCGFFIIGFVDDLRSLPALPRLIGQFAVAFGVVWYGEGLIRINSLFGKYLLADWLAIAITVVWIVGIVNTLNWIDGLDGLCAGIGGISTLAFVTLALIKPNQPNALLTIIIGGLLIGALIGFLIFNFHPAKIFIGDGGAFSLGYLLAVLSVVGLFKQAAAITFMLPLLILALPITDTALAILRRLVAGRPITKPDNHHIHHRILALMSRAYRARLSEAERTALSQELQVNPAHRSAVLALYVFAIIFAAAAVIVGVRT
ncbi:undecaprenyl/decaprenyl-phosphate alpha-N-acetylglucosaminyl 1-phosphate transferase [bacterium]|nr:undecaprenyl/decaprenyl-phosphate alpha-N-acetylglucosaminyl 1-phosphate transferase [bacterium]